MGRSLRALVTASIATFGIAFAAQGCIISNGDDDDATSTGNAGNGGTAGSGGTGGTHVCGDPYEKELGPIARSCGAPTDNECDGSVDVNTALPNGANGNMFDDDCDGLVDEGCECPTGSFAGDIRDCWLVPSSQVDEATGLPVGWCSEHAGGTRRCVAGEMGQPDLWSGECRGAQAPQASDHCVEGDYDCDGLDANSEDDCACVDDAELVTCPTDPIVTAPFPDPTQLLVIDGADWVNNGAGDTTTDWQWSVTGGDCDNILPHPSFAVYDAADSTTATRIGDVSEGLGESGNQRGFVVTGGQPQVYPAFALSGDYVVKGEFQLDGVPYACSVKVHVRAPGIRAEACWTPMPNDMDLHFARLQNNNNCPSGNHGWFDTCDFGEQSEDCYYSNCTGFGATPSTWGYERSDDTACKGWGSRRTGDCDNPRLDLDNIVCDPSNADPSNADMGSSFCGAENINVDNPSNGDRFAVGLYAFSISEDVQSHLNIYCNGERRLSLGYDDEQQFPVSQVSGSDQSGDLWQAVVVEAIVDASGVMTDCVITPIHSSTPDPIRDGSESFCVDRDPQGGMANGSSEWYFQPGGAIPTDANQMCWH